MRHLWSEQKHRKLRERDGDDGGDVAEQQNDLNEKRRINMKEKTTKSKEKY